MGHKNNMDGLIESIISDQRAGKQIARITISPALWGTIRGRVGSDQTAAHHGLAREEMPSEARTLENFMGIPLAIDELQEESYQLWNRAGGPIEPGEI